MSKSALAESYLEFAKRIQTGRGFWEGTGICNDPKKCQEKKKEMIKLADHYFNH